MTTHNQDALCSLTSRPTWIFAAIATALVCGTIAPYSTVDAQGPPNKTETAAIAAPSELATMKSARCPEAPVDVTAASSEEHRLACSAAIDALQLLTDEYPAYALQIESLAADVREEFLQSFDQSAIKAASAVFNDVVLFFDPYFFSARAYHHFNASANGCAHLAALLDGEVSFIAPPM